MNNRKPPLNIFPFSSHLCALLSGIFNGRVTFSLYQGVLGAACYLAGIVVVDGILSE